MLITWKISEYEKIAFNPEDVQMVEIVKFSYSNGDVFCVVANIKGEITQISMNFNRYNRADAWLKLFVGKINAALENS